MATTVTELYNQFVDELDEEASGELQSIFVRYANQCSKNIQQWAGVQSTWDVAIVVGTETYAKPATLYKPLFGRFLATGTTDELANYSDMEVLNEYDWNGTGFWVTNSTVYVRPKPATAGNLKIYGDKVLATLASDSSLEIDDECSAVYLWYALMRYSSRDEETERYSYFSSEFERAKNDLIARYMEKESMRG